MAWVRLDDGYPDHPKIDKAGPLAAWLNVCAWAYCARNLTDGFVPSERINRLADVPKPHVLVQALLETELWHEAQSPCDRCRMKREVVGAEPVTGNGYLVHDYLLYNESRAEVLGKRETAKRRITDWRRNRASNAVTPGITTPDTPPVTNGVRTEEVRLAPNPNPNPNPNRGAFNAPGPPGEQRVIETRDAVIAAVGFEPNLSDADRHKIAHSTAPPGVIAEVYGAVYRGEYGDDFMRRRLSVGEAIGWIDGYRAFKAQPAAVGAVQDNTGQGWIT